MKKTLLILALLTLSALVISAQTHTPQINKAQKNQHARIKQGIKSGELTKHETAVLVKEQKHIQKEKAAAKADGVVTPKERKHIQKDLQKASKDIAVKKHNIKKRKL